MSFLSAYAIVALILLTGSCIGAHIGADNRMREEVYGRSASGGFFISTAIALLYWLPFVYQSAKGALGRTATLATPMNGSTLSTVNPALLLYGGLGLALVIIPVVMSLWGWRFYQRRELVRFIANPLREPTRSIFHAPSRFYVPPEKVAERFECAIVNGALLKKDGTPLTLDEALSRPKA